MLYRELELEDYEAYNALRAIALDTAPQAFLMTNAEESELRKARFEDTPNHPHKFMMGAFEENKLVGMMGFVKQERKKAAHKGEIWGVFVLPEKQGQGIATNLLKLTIDKAFKIEELRQIILGVNSANPKAIALYEKAGFTLWGIEKDALHTNGQFYNENMMVIFRPKS
jgi:RimJ/RimL family protein N-acetyltransferase